MNDTLRILGLIAIAYVGLPCIAQNVQTWGGLRFGMTELQVRTALKARGFKPVGFNNPNEQPADKSFGLRTVGTVAETAVKGFDGKATILLDKTRRRWRSET